MKTEYQIVLLFLFGILLVVALGTYSSKKDFITPEGYSFCVEEGYDSVSLYGSYSERYGQVECFSCYKDDCIYKEFNVTKKFGLIVEDKK